MDWEESKENANRDSFSHPPSKIKKHNESFQRQRRDSQDGQSDMIGAKEGSLRPANNTHSIPSQLDDTNSKSKSAIASNINQSQAVLSNSDRLGANRSQD